MVNLSYEKSTQRYRRMVKGCRFASTVGASKREATQQYERWHQETFKQDLQGFKTLKELEEHQQAREHAAAAASALGLDDEGDEQSEMILDEVYRASYKAARNNLSQIRDDGLTQLVKKYLDFKATKVSPGQVVVLGSHLKFLTEQLASPEVSADDWESLLGELNTRKAKGTWSGKYAHDVLVSIKSFFAWAKKRITVPYFIHERTADNSISIPKTKIEFFSNGELKVFLAECSEQFKIICLIALNCGCTQEDVSQLDWDMIDFKAGTLTRMRTKHKHRGDGEKVLTVVYTLWPEIIAYLKTLEKRSGRVFTRDDGSALCQEKRNDLIAKWYRQVAKKIGQETKSFKHFRKTGTTAMAKKLIYRGLRPIYLANSPKDVTDVSYDGNTILPAEVTKFIKKELGL